MRAALGTAGLLLPVLAWAAIAAPVSSPLVESPAEALAALRAARIESRAAEARRAELEQAAQNASDAAERAAREAAVVASRIQETEAAIAVAEARLALAVRERALLREELGHEQQPVVQLTAALQQFSRRPLGLSVLRPGSVQDAVYLRAMLDSAVPQIQERTAGLRSRLARSRDLRAEALAARDQLRAEQTRLTNSRAELAALEARQRLASDEARGDAQREAERALALAEEARDLDSLVGQLERAGDLRARLAALPGPTLRPARPEEGRQIAASARPVTEPAAASAPDPYLLPVVGRTVVGFGAPLPSGPSRGLTLAPRPGAQVVAPAAGRVAFAGPYRGYGQIVIIEHAGGWTSLITGLGRSDVSVGDELVAGAPLGIAAQARPEVTLELRRSGEPVNPLRLVG